MAIGLGTYQSTTRAEDVVDIVTNITPSETPLLSGLGRAGDATNTYHEYLTDTFAAYSDNAVAEGADATIADLTPPTRAGNITQIFRKVVQVTGTEQAVTSYEGNAMDYQKTKNAVELAKDIELALMAGSTASGASGNARRLTGVINGISTNSTTRTSGTSLSESDFNDIFEMIYNGSGVNADEVYCGATMKRDISGFTAGQTRNIAADDRRLINSVDVYETDFGMVKIMLHRNVPSGANAKGVVAIKNDLWKLAFLQNRGIQYQELGKTGDADKGMYIAELTLENRAEAANAFVTGFTS